MRTLNLSGFQVGDNLSVSVSQGAITAGPYNVSSWGGGEDAGPVSIVVDQTALKVAPDSVAFTVDLSSASFDAPAPGVGETYDARMHDLMYIWDFGDSASGDWSAPVNVLAHWKDRNKAMGPFVAHVYNTPRPASGGAGTGYTVSLTIYEVSSGKTASATAEIFVEDPDTVYSGAKTVAINPTGDSDFADKPTGALEDNIDTLNATNLAAYIGATDRRIVLKRGAAYTCEFNLSGAGHIQIEDYGNSELAKPELNPVQGGGNAITTSIAKDIRLRNLNFQGSFDPETQSDLTVAGAGEHEYGVGGGGAANVICSKVDFDGLLSTTSFTHDVRRKIHFDDCISSNMGGNYPFFAVPSTDAGTYMVMTGCRLAQPPTAHDQASTGGGSTHALIRWNECAKIHIRGCDFFHTDSERFNIRLNSGAGTNGRNITNVHTCSMEGGAGGITWCGDPFNATSGAGISTNQNGIFDSLIYIGAHWSQKFAQLGATGATVRNCYVFIPNVPVPTGPAMKEWISLFTESAFNETEVDAEPVRAYNNTFVFRRSAAGNLSNAIDHFKINQDVPGQFTAHVWQNNIVDQSSYTTDPENTHPPLKREALPWAAHRYGGRRFADSIGTLDLTKATPTGEIPYDGGTGDFVSGEIVTASGASAGTATVLRVEGSTSTGRLFVSGISGTFADNATLSGSTAGAATASANLVDTSPAIYIPDTGSAALGGVNKAHLYAWGSINQAIGTRRPDGSEDVGAWEVA